MNLTIDVDGFTEKEIENFQSRFDDFVKSWKKSTLHRRELIKKYEGWEREYKKKLALEKRIEEVIRKEIENR